MDGRHAAARPRSMEVQSVTWIDALVLTVLVLVIIALIMWWLFGP